MYDTFWHGLNDEHGIVEDVSMLLKQAHAARKKKSAALYEEWDAQVMLAWRDTNLTSAGSMCITDNVACMPPQK
jgi:hypothetical protein